MIQRNHEGRRIGESHHKARHPDAIVREARRLKGSGLGYKRIARTLGVPVPTVVDWCTYATRYSA